MPNQERGRSSEGDISPIDIQKYIGGLNFPVDKDELVEHAREKNAPQNIIDFMDRFPEKEYNSPMDISQAFSEVKH